MYAALNGVALAIIAKAGTQSFTEAGADWYMNNLKALDYPTRVMFIREPFDRLESCYSFFKMLIQQGTKFNMLPEAALDSWEEFVDYILTHEDEHWAPQTDSVLYKGELTPTHIMRFDELNKWWPEFFSAKLVHTNASERLEVPPYRVADLTEYYKNDIAEYNSAIRYEGVKEWPLP